jgi:hypothetical protein
LVISYSNGNDKHNGEIIFSSNFLESIREVLKMLDLIFIGALVGFFLAMLAYVNGCEKLKGKGNES